MQTSNPLSLDQLSHIIIDAIEDLKGKNIAVIDIAEISNYADRLVIVSGTSNTHLKAIANNVVVQCKAADYPPLSSEGETSDEWILIDLGEIVVHVMTPQARDFYDLERLWSSTTKESDNK